MVRRDSSGSRLAAAFATVSDPAEDMPPTGAWPPILRDVLVGDDPPTVPVLLGGGAGRTPARNGAGPHADGPAPRGAPPRAAGRAATASEHGDGGPAAVSPGPVAAVVRAVLPAAWRGARIDPGRPGATALVLVAALAALVAAVGVWLDRPQTEPVGSAAALPAVVVTSAPAAGPPVPETTQAPTAPLVLSVSGKVHRPGLVELPDGARVADALEAAGGALPGTDLSSLNLARRVVDGEQVAVGVPQAPDAVVAPAPGPAGTDAAAGTGPVDLNTATEGQLDALPGVGPVTAQRILEWRRRNGRFSRVEQLREIEGIGERRFAQLRELVVV